MSASKNMQAVSEAIARAEGPSTVAEIADLAGISVSSARSARSAILALHRRGEVDRYGVALSGGICWGVSR